jgi:hypothetical protein
MVELIRISLNTNTLPFDSPNVSNSLAHKLRLIPNKSFGVDSQLSLQILRYHIKKRKLSIMDFCAKKFQNTSLNIFMHSYRCLLQVTYSNLLPIL